MATFKHSSSVAQYYDTETEHACDTLYKEANVRVNIVRGRLVQPPHLKFETVEQGRVTSLASGVVMVCVYGKDER